MTDTYTPASRTESRVATAVLVGLGILFLILITAPLERMPVAPWSPMGQERQLQQDAPPQPELQPGQLPAPAVPAPPATPVAV